MQFSFNLFTRIDTLTEFLLSILCTEHQAYVLWCTFWIYILQKFLQFWACFATSTYPVTVSLNVPVLDDEVCMSLPFCVSYTLLHAWPQTPNPVPTFLVNSPSNESTITVSICGGLANYVNITHGSHFEEYLNIRIQCHLLFPGFPLFTQHLCQASWCSYLNESLILLCVPSQTTLL